MGDNTRQPERIIYDSLSEALDAPLTPPPAILGMALFTQGREAAIHCRIQPPRSSARLYWRLTLIETLACVEHYLGTDTRHALQRNVQDHLREGAS